LPTSHPWADLQQIWCWDNGRGRNYPCKMFNDRLRDDDSVGVENKSLPLTKPVAVNTVAALQCNRVICPDWFC